MRLHSHLLMTCLESFVRFTSHRGPLQVIVPSRLTGCRERCSSFAIQGAPRDDELFESSLFFKRRHREAASLQRRIGCWSHRWATQVVKWHSHIRRDPIFSWPSQLLDVRSSANLQERRRLWNRPRTRVLPGFTHARWTECYFNALEVHRRHNNTVIS